MTPLHDLHQQLNRRTLLQGSAAAAGTAALAGLLAREGRAEVPRGIVPTQLAPKAKRIIYLFQSGGPSHLELLE